MAWDNLIARVMWLFIQPSNFFFLLLLLGLFFTWRRHRGKAVFTLLFCATLYGLVMFGPLTNWLLTPLEKRFASYTNQVEQGPYSGIIVLAGAERLDLSSDHKQVSLSGAGERLIEAAKLARQFPNMPVIFCGGARIDDGMSEGDVARKFFREAGIDIGRIRFEEKSYNTYTNAMEARKLIATTETAPWLLVTSAFHMPRSVAAFRAAHIPVQPYPVDYRTELNNTAFGKPDAAGNFTQFDYAVHEWVGLLTYYIRGNTTEVFPKAP
ncbi:YdcF family protein [Paremcibacter congregatus]|uniref:YdcF family protein n=1 Tax=Paremcibacter congregatus TaxID=2043170 RepID=UPI0030EC57CD